MQNNDAGSWQQADRHQRYAKCHGHSHDLSSLAAVEETATQLRNAEATQRPDDLAGKLTSPRNGDKQTAGTNRKATRQDKRQGSTTVIIRGCESGRLPTETERSNSAHRNTVTHKLQPPSLTRPTAEKFAVVVRVDSLAGQATTRRFRPNLSPINKAGSPQNSEPSPHDWQNRNQATATRSKSRLPPGNNA